MKKIFTALLLVICNVRAYPQSMTTSPPPAYPKLSEKMGKIAALAIGVCLPDSMDPISNSLFDMLDVRDTFEKMHIDVKPLTNPSHKELREELLSQSKMMWNNRLFILYMSGHGLYANGEDYFLSADADIHSPENLRHTAFSLVKMINLLGRNKRTIILVIFDACRREPPADVLDKFIRQHPVDTLITSRVFYAYACAPGKFSLADPHARNSYYTAGLLIHLRDTISFAEICTAINRDVRRLSKEREVPATISCLGENIYLQSGDVTLQNNLSDKPDTTGPDSLIIKGYHSYIRSKTYTYDFKSADAYYQLPLLFRQRRCHYKVTLFHSNTAFLHLLKLRYHVYSNPTIRVAKFPADAKSRRRQSRPSKENGVGSRSI